MAKTFQDIRARNEAQREEPRNPRYNRKTHPKEVGKEIQHKKATKKVSSRYPRSQEFVLVSSVQIYS